MEQAAPQLQPGAVVKTPHAERMVCRLQCRIRMPQKSCVPMEIRDVPPVENIPYPAVLLSLVSGTRNTRPQCT
jgi:hypothetical protein